MLSHLPILNHNLTKDRRIMIRVDFNVDLSDDGQIVDPSRIQAHLPTIIDFHDNNKGQIVLVSHLAPAAGIVPMLPIAKYLSKVLDEPIKVIAKPGSKVSPTEYSFGGKKIPEGNLLLLENTRYNRGEFTNNYYVARHLADYADIFVLDALSVAHRAHASVVGIARHIPAYAGPLLVKEVGTLERVMQNPARPFIVIIGGKKVEDKGPVIEHLLPIADKILVGGKVGMILSAQGAYHANRKVILANDCDKDIGPSTITRFYRALQDAKTILWAGPMGIVEQPPFDTGTRAIAEAVIACGAYKIIAGGDTQKALVGMNLADKMDFISQGGGATLEFLSGNKLPGLKTLGYYS